MASDGPDGPGGIPNIRAIPSVRPSQRAQPPQPSNVEPAPLVDPVESGQGKVASDTLAATERWGKALNNGGLTPVERNGIRIFPL